MRNALLLLALAVAAEAPSPPKAPACAAAPRRGEFIDVNSEEALIVYDAKTKTEHFIRRANFRTEAKDFGFLVPTPTKPEIGEAKASIFVTLHEATAPRRVDSGKVQRIVIKRNEPQAMAGARAPGAPEILGKGDSAGYAYVILRADDIDGLKKWLEENKYDSRPELIDWLKWYVDNKWIITAFKVLLEPNARNERYSKSVRMSFATDKPFYPYREPADMQKRVAGGQRTLRVFYLGDDRVEGQLDGKEAWGGGIVWTNELPEHSLNAVADGLGLTRDNVDKVKDRKWRLTEFEDHSSPRPGTAEVYFTSAKDQSTVERPVIYFDRYEYVYEDTTKTPLGEVDRTELWLILIGLLVLVGAVAVALLLVMRKKSPPESMD